MQWKCLSKQMQQHCNLIPQYHSLSLHQSRCEAACRLDSHCRSGPCLYVTFCSSTSVWTVKWCHEWNSHGRQRGSLMAIRLWSNLNWALKICRVHGAFVLMSSIKKQVFPEGVQVIYEAMQLLAMDVRVYFPSSINLGNLGKDMNQFRKRGYWRSNQSANLFL